MTATRARLAAAGPGTGATTERRIHVVQGEHRVTDDPNVVLSTLLGSCVAACMRDPLAGVGGMNHFLLPGDHDGGRTTSLHHGVHAMELLVNALLGLGAQRHRLEAKLFGGGRMLRGLTDVGEQNAAFAQRFLRNEGVRFLGGSLGGDRGRRLQYWPVSGRARQAAMEAGETRVFAVEREAPVETETAGSLELF